MRARHLIGVRFLKPVDTSPSGYRRTIAITTYEHGREIRLIEEDEVGWSVIDEELNVASQGETRETALEMLDEAVALHKVDHRPADGLTKRDS